MTPPAARRRRPGGAPLGAAITPMIDVVFLLLVFLLCTASLEAPESDLAASLRVEANVGAGVGDPAEPDDTLASIEVVGRRVGQQTRWAVNGGAEAEGGPGLESLLGKLGSIDTTLPITIDAQSDVPVGDVVAAYDAARRVGFGRVLLAASAGALGEVAP